MAVLEILSIVISVVALSWTALTWFSDRSVSLKLSFEVKRVAPLSEADLPLRKGGLGVRPGHWEAPVLHVANKRPFPTEIYDFTIDGRSVARTR